MSTGRGTVPMSSLRYSLIFSLPRSVPASTAMDCPVPERPESREMIPLTKSVFNGFPSPSISSQEVIR